MVVLPAMNITPPPAQNPAPQLSSGTPATSLGRALRILGDPWTMLILKEAFNGTRRFSAFQRALQIPRQTLSLRLAHLCDEQMLYRRFVGPGQGVLEYAATAKALDLSDAMYAVWLWHQANPGGGDILPFDIVHADCGHRIGATWRCTECGDPVTSQDVTIARSHPEQIETEGRPRLSRRNDASFTAANSQATGTVAASLVGDQPCNELLYLLFQGPRHMQALGQELSLGPGILRNRLDKLMTLGLVSETAEGRRLIYTVLPRAEGFYPLLLAIADWGDRWCNGSQPPPDVRIHSCGALLRGRYMCDHCGGWLRRQDLTIRMRPPADR
jgi:DNA-binding HxlR family transcriptional regulator